MFLLLALACASPDDGGCTDWPGTAVDPDGSVSESCGYWAVPVGDHLYANVYTTEPQAVCSEALGAGLSLFSSPIYSAMSDDAPKWTYDIVAEAAGTALGVDITCDDGTRWSARVDVE